MSNPTRTAREQFDRQATHYDVRWNAWSAETLNWIIDAADCRPGDAVLDVATGSGFTAVEFANRAASVIGTDVSTGMLAEARTRAKERGAGNVTFSEAPAESLPFDDGSFDIVACRIAAHHFVDVAKFVKESFRVLKPEGRFVLVDTTVPDDNETLDRWQNGVEAVRDPSHVRNYSPSEWRRFVERAGFVLGSVTDAGNGITIPLDDWIAKAGCTPEQGADVRARFANAPQAARDAFQIHVEANGATVFTWRRVLLKAVKKNSN
ncbi:MAG: methyltransferase domain-containing protein [Capsulimonadaceae bacterium]|nr:methyltransferase domain-containing protein [Capsulimonadaceae bacterium]